MSKLFYKDDMVEVNPLGLQYVIHLDEVFEENSYYRAVLSILNNACEGDEVKFLINSPGGSFSAGMPIISAMRDTKATTVGVLLCEAHSMASMVLMCCDSYVINPYCSMLVHSASYGTVGKMEDVRSYVTHSHELLTEVLKDVYYGFFTEEEMELILLGKEHYCGYEEICQRLKARQEVINQEQQDMLDSVQEQLPSKEELMKKSKKEILEFFMPSEIEEGAV